MDEKWFLEKAIFTRCLSKKFRPKSHLKRCRFLDHRIPISASIRHSWSTIINQKDRLSNAVWRSAVHVLVLWFLSIFFFELRINIVHLCPEFAKHGAFETPDRVASRLCVFEQLLFIFIEVLGKVSWSLLQVRHSMQFRLNYPANLNSQWGLLPLPL